MRTTTVEVRKIQGIEILAEIAKVDCPDCGWFDDNSYRPNCPRCESTGFVTVTSPLRRASDIAYAYEIANAPKPVTYASDILGR